MAQKLGGLWFIVGGVAFAVADVVTAGGGVAWAGSVPVIIGVWVLSLGARGDREGLTIRNIPLAASVSWKDVRGVRLEPYAGPLSGARGTVAVYGPAGRIRLWATTYDPWFGRQHAEDAVRQIAAAIRDFGRTTPQ